MHLTRRPAALAALACAFPALTDPIAADVFGGPNAATVTARIDSGNESIPATLPAESGENRFRSNEDGEFDISGFLASKQGFFPLAIPITEPAVGYGLAGGLTFFHDRIRTVEGPDGKSRALLPTTTLVAGGGTVNGTWFGAVGHLHNFNNGSIRYLGGVGYGSVNLDWYGTSDALEGRPISYTNEVFGLVQQVVFDISDTGFYTGPRYRFLAADASFAREAESLISPDQFQSQTGGLGVLVGFDSRDHPFSPTRGVKFELAFTQNASWLGGDFNYGALQAFVLGYIPITTQLTLGARFDMKVVGDEAPFYDLSFVSLRGISVARFVNDVATVAELELRWDVSRRWSLVCFGGAGRVADSIGDLSNEDSCYAGGAGFRYLIADKFGLRLGLDAAYGEDDVTIYVSVGTGWLRP